MTASRPNLNVICGTLAAVGTGCGVLYNARGDGKRRERLQSWNYPRRNRRGNCGINETKHLKS
jgi:hypothetical protein